ncbi:MAG: hypothetical protein RLZZ350_2229 [Verrucomicrobiota bacterium]
MKLSTLAISLGLGYALLQLFALLQPAKFTAAVKKFPRDVTLGWVLMLAATVWFIWNVNQEADADFATMKPKMMVGFAAIGLGCCIFVQDFLAARGLAVLLLLLAKLMVDTARWADTDWRWVVSGWAYLLVVAGIWFTTAPWKLRDVIAWQTASAGRLKMLSVLKLAFGIFVVALGCLVF